MNQITLDSPPTPPVARPAVPEVEHRRRRSWPVPLLVLAIGGGAFLVGRATDTSNVDPVRSEAAVPAAQAPVTGDPEEPVTAVAEALGRSVVQIETGSGLGSGIVYGSEGHILTAAHVVDGAGDSVTIRLPDGERVDGTVIGTDPETDVAVLEIERTGLPAATFAVGRNVRVGQTAIAIGSPFGLEGSVTAGVVSAVDRSITTESGASVSMIQTDASINPGNSGGALADARGRVIGINDAIRSDSGVNSGVGFAIPIDVAVTVADALLAGEEPEFGFLGIGGTDPTEGAAGALVTAITPGSGADEAGLREGDVITGFDGQAIEGMSELASLIRSTPPGETVEISVLRDDDVIDLNVRIGTD